MAWKLNCWQKWNSVFQAILAPGMSLDEILWDRSTEQQLIEKLKTYPLTKVDAPESRAQAATSVLKTLLEAKKQKIYLFKK